MPSSRGSRQKESRGLSDGGSGYKLVPQVDGGSPVLSGTCPEGVGTKCDFPFALAPSSFVESLLDDAIGSTESTGDKTHYSLQDFLESYVMQAATILVIMANAIVIGFETDMPDLTQWDFIENVFLAVFTFELGTKLLVFGPTSFFRCRNNPDISWNIFDMVIVSFGLFNVVIEFLMGDSGKMGKDATLFRMIRLLRILRVLRIIRIVRFLKQLYLLAYGFMEGTMAVFWVTLLASFALYICSVILVRTYGRVTQAEDDNWEFFREHFGNIPRTMFNLFELLCAPDLVVYRHIMFQYPPLVVFLITFIVLGSFGINGLLVALINESILEKNQARIEADRMEREAKRKLMQQRCREVFDSIDVNGNRVLPRNEIMKCKGLIHQLFEESGAVFRSHDLDQMFYIMDYNDTGIIERGEFVQGVVEMCDQIRPMSIMELHCQVSKCASKIEACDNKMEGLAKAIEEIEAKEEERLKQADYLVERLRGTADKMQVLYRQQENKPDPVPVLNGPPLAPSPVTASSSRSLVSAVAASSDSDSYMKWLLEDEQAKLAEASTLVSSLLSGDRSRASPSEVLRLGSALFRLQHQTTKVLEAVFAQSNGASGSGVPEESPVTLHQVAVSQSREGSQGSSRSNPEPGRWGSSQD